MKFIVENRYMSFNKSTLLAELPKFAIISGVNGAGKSQLLQGIKYGDIHVLENDGSIISEPLFESLWTINQKGFDRASFYQNDNVKYAILNTHSPSTIALL